MVARLRWVGLRVADLGRGIADTLLRDNRILPPVLALLALFVFAWVLAGVFLGGSDDQKPVAHRSEIAQANGEAGSDPAAPAIDNPNVDSYAAYRSKDPFRQIFAIDQTTPEGTVSPPPEQTTTGPGGPNGDGPANGGNRRAADSDGDGLPDRRELAQGLDPNNPDRPTATEFRTASQRAAGMTGQAGEDPAQAAGKDEAVICSTAVGYYLHLSGPAARPLRQFQSLNFRPAW